MTLTEHIDRFVKFLDEMKAKHWEKQGYTFSKPPIHEAKINGKWCKIVILEECAANEHNSKMIDGICRRVSSVFCFICMEDGETKTLGKLKAGDIHKAASWKAPAKTARGSVFFFNPYIANVKWQITDRSH